MLRCEKFEGFYKLTKTYNIVFKVIEFGNPFSNGIFLDEESETFQFVLLKLI